MVCRDSTPFLSYSCEIFQFPFLSRAFSEPSTLPSPKRSSFSDSTFSFPQKLDYNLTLLPPASIPFPFLRNGLSPPPPVDSLLFLKPVGASSLVRAPRHGCGCGSSLFFFLPIFECALLPFFFFVDSVTHMDFLSNSGFSRIREIDVLFRYTRTDFFTWTLLRFTSFSSHPLSVKRSSGEPHGATALFFPHAI